MSKLTALIVDDNEGSRTAFQTFFSDWDVETAVDGEVGQKKLNEKTYDVVVLDRNMPNMGGNEVLRWMATRAEHQYTCTIMCTAFGELDEAVESLKLGAWNYVAKPVKNWDLMRALLLPGIAFKRCNKARSELFAAQDLPSFFEKLRDVCRWAAGDAGGLHLLLVAPDGKVIASEGDVDRSRIKSRHAFVDRVMKQGDTWVFADTKKETQALEPIRAESKTLAAVAVRGIGGRILGVLDMEASAEKAFGAAWREVLRYIADLVAIRRVNEIRAQQLASTMIYREIRHRIATHAQVVSMQTGELLEANKDLPPDPRRLQIIKRNAETIDSIVRGLREVADEPTPTWSTCDSLVQLLRDSAEQSDARRSQKSEPPTDYQWNERLADCKVRADVAELQYTFECILDNAWEAIAERYRQDPDCKKGWTGSIKIGVAEEGLGVTVTVTDNGIGFEPREKDLLFSPLYSTKTRMPEGKERDEKGVERISRVLNTLGWALSIDKEAEKALDDTDLAGAEISIRDEGRVAEIEISHQALANGKIRLSQTVTGSRSDENRGIGLFSARRTILQHGGLIEAKSDGVFKGAVFTIWLPKQA